jgi:hypothetical protein
MGPVQDREWEGAARDMRVANQHTDRELSLHECARVTTPMPSQRVEESNAESTRAEGHRCNDACKQTSILSGTWYVTSYSELSSSRLRCDTTQSSHTVGHRVRLASDRQHSTTRRGILLEYKFGKARRQRT